MIRCFRSSRWIIAAGLVAAAAFAAAAFVYRPQVALWLNIITAALIFALLYIVSRLAANIAATNANAKLLGILHVDLDPDRFLAAYRDIPARVPASSYLHTVTSSYLAAGYAARGDYAQAESTLFTDFSPSRSEKNDLAVRALIHDNLCEFALLQKDAARAEKELAQLREVLQRAAVLNPDLTRNYRATVFLYEQWLRVLSGEPADEKRLAESLSHTPIRLRRLATQMLMAESYAMRRQNGPAREMYRAVIAEGGKTHFVADAQSALDAMAQGTPG